MNHTSDPAPRTLNLRPVAILSRLGIAVAGVAIVLSLAAGSSAAKPRGLSGMQPFRTTSHVPTWAMDDGCSGGAGASSSFVRSWVTFAESSCGPRARKADTNCHGQRRTYCFVIQYLETATSNGLATIAGSPSSSWWLHEPSPNGGTPIISGGNYIVDQANPAVQAFFRSYVRRNYNSDDGLMLDGQAPALSEELYNASCGCQRTREIATNAALQAAHRKFSEALTHRNGAPFIQIDNALAPNPFLPQGINMLNAAHGVDGLVIEGDPESYGTLDPYYSTLLDQIAAVATKKQGFVMALSYGYAGASSQQQSRRVQEGTVMLGYSPGHLVDWEDLELGSGNLAIWPEEGIYPTHPIESMHRPGGRGCLAGRGDVCSVGGHNSLQVAHGVYRREFGACYDRNARIGSCAAIVNTTGSWVTVRSSWLRRTYRHQIAFVGGDVQSGGGLSLAAPFAAGVTAIAPYDAVLMAS